MTGILVTAHEHDLLFAMRALERDGDPPKGLASKTYLEDEYGEVINYA